MQSRRGIGGLTRPGRGDIDLEKLQDAFMKSAEMPSAKVTRSKVRCYLIFEILSILYPAIATRSRQSPAEAPRSIAQKRRLL